jgi:hypothetical protein
MGASVAACPACGFRFEGRHSGAETNVFPEPEARAPGDEQGVPGAASGSQTVLLRATAVAPPSRRLELKLQPMLILESGVHVGQQLVVECPETVVGREDASITIDDPTLSGRHFAIEEQGHEFFLRDLESTNGTFLNGHAVRSAKLESGDRIRAGETSLLFRVRQVIPWY